MPERQHHKAPAPAGPGRAGAAHRSADDSPAVERLTALQRLADDGVVQRAFAPHLVTSNAHLRNNGIWGTKIGAKINSGAEVVADPADQQTQNRRGLFSNVTWTKAVNKTGEAWDQAADAGANTYIRGSSVGAAVDYTTKPAKPKIALQEFHTHSPQPRWNETLGYYEIYDDSAFHAGHKIVRKGNALQRMNPAATVLTGLDADEQRQMNRTALRQHLFDHVKGILQAASNGHAWQAEFIKDENVTKLLDDDNGSKAIRLFEGSRLMGADFANWYHWLPGPYARLQAGATFTRNMFIYWSTYLTAGGAPTPPATLVEINLTGSDLHEEGLGAIITKFQKPNAVGPAPYTNQTDVDVILKSERKEIEKALFGTQGGSLANQVNAATGLNANEEIKTFHMATSNNYGSMIKMVRNARQLNRYGGDQMDPTAAFYEAMTFAFMTGMSDLHYENVLWSDTGEPYFIDADNALNTGRMLLNLPENRRKQGGFNVLNSAASGEVTNKLANDQAYQSKILEALRHDNPGAVIPVVPLIRATFAGKSGRVVPITTGSWGNSLRNFYIKYPAGVNTDGEAVPSRWGLAEYWSHRVNISSDFGVGLEGETGKTGNGGYQRNPEKQQIKADFDQGQIPFYVYDYNTGHVTHNGTHIWNGRTLGDAIAALVVKFPNQPPH